MLLFFFSSFFFFNDTATTEIYTLSLHDALPILLADTASKGSPDPSTATAVTPVLGRSLNHIASPVVPESSDRKSTRLNSSHLGISYAVFCLKKKKKQSFCTALTGKCPRLS